MRRQNPSLASLPTTRVELSLSCRSVAWFEQKSSIEKSLPSNGHRPTISHGHIAYMLRERNLLCWTNMRCIDYISASWRTWTHSPSLTPSPCSSSRWDGPSTTLKRFEQIVPKWGNPGALLIAWLQISITNVQRLAEEIQNEKSWFLLNA